MDVDSVYSNNSNISNEISNNSTSLNAEVGKWIWLTLGPVIFLVGMTGNMLVVVVLTRMKFHRSPYLIYLFVLAFADMTALLSGIPRILILQGWPTVDIRTTHDVACKFALFFIYTSMSYSSWVLVAVTVERFLQISFPLRFNRLHSVKAAIIILSALFLIVTVVNMHFFWTNGLTDKECGSIGPRNYHFDENVFTWIDLLVLSIIPSTIMIICNVFIFRTLRRFRTRYNRTNIGGERDENDTIVVMLVVVNVVFLFTTLPNSVYFIVDTFTADMQTKSTDFSGRLALSGDILYLIQFLNYTLNFYLYTGRSETFKRECNRLLCFKARYEYKRKNTSMTTPSTATETSHM